MQADNPYTAPTTEATYLDPRLHAQVRLEYTLTEEDLRAGVKGYLYDDPHLMLIMLWSLLVPGLILAFLEEVYGFSPPIPVGVGVVMWLGAAFSVRYLASLPMRIRVQRNLRDSVLGVGPKSICFHPESVEVDNGEEQVEFDLKDVTMRGSMKHRYLLLVLESHSILIVPHHAFVSHTYFSKFRKLMVTRLRNQRDFWSFKL